MSEIHKKTCDNCKKEKDLLAMVFGVLPIWQEIKERDEHNMVIVRDFCSIKCVVEYFYKDEVKI